MAGEQVLWFGFTVGVVAYLVWCVVAWWRDGRERFDPDADSHVGAAVEPPPSGLAGHGDWSVDEELSALSPAAIELLLEEHYRQVLSSPEGRKMWRRLLADEAAARRLGMKK